VNGPRVVFMGSPEFAVPSLRALVAHGYNVAAVYTQPDRPAGRGRRLAPPPVKVAAEEYGLPVVQPERLRGRKEMERLRALGPDLIVVAAYGQILRPAVVDLPRHGVVNVHASLLPRWRGASPIPAAILAGDPFTGVSIMRIDYGLDTGPVLARIALPIEDDDTTGTLTEKLATLGAEKLAETLPAWLSGAIVPEPQDETLATHAGQIAKDDARIDWARSATAIWRAIRAYNPWPLATTSLRGESVQILSGVPVSVPATVNPTASRLALLPGEIATFASIASTPPTGHEREAAFVVGTGDGLLTPLTLRRAGRNAVTAAEFARGLRAIDGLRFGT
jgi:methionyl-tRNA formyltransferase